MFFNCLLNAKAFKDADLILLFETFLVQFFFFYNETFNCPCDGNYGR